MMSGTETGTKRTWWAWAVATFFGAGLLKPGPGTFGSVAATAIWFVTMRYVPVDYRPHITLLMAVCAVLIGIPAATRVAHESGRKDPQIVVIDEVAGQWIALIFAVHSLPFALLALVLFRVFDILKPPPIRRLEHLPRGIGIVLDDVAAGIYALLLGALVLQPVMILHLPHR